MRLVTKEELGFFPTRVEIKEKAFIKESNKTKLFVNKEGCYVSDNRQDVGEYKEYEIKELIEIREDTVPINEKDEYIILYESSKGEDILVIGKKNKDYGHGKFRLNNSLKMITQKGLQLVYNMNTKVLYERKVNLKQEFVKEEVEEKIEPFIGYHKYFSDQVQKDYENRMKEGLQSILDKRAMRDNTVYSSWSTAGLMSGDITPFGSYSGSLTDEDIKIVPNNDGTTNDPIK
jgi:hypothetical protein